MFSWFSSLQDRKKSNDVSAYIRRICDLSAPNRSVTDDHERLETRYNRTIAIAIAPWENGKPDPKAAIFATTRDISDRGVSVITTEPFNGDVVVVFALPEEEANEPWFFLGNAVHSQSIGGCWWATGIALFEFANVEHRRNLAVLENMAQLLLPKATAV